MIYLAGDQKTTELIAQIEKYLKTKGISYVNLGAKDKNTPTPLQIIIPAVTTKLQSEPGALGILACGTGTGVEIGANRFRGIRASLCRDAKQAEYARVYDNANVLCLGSWFNNDIEAILDAWFSNKFDGSPTRTQMLSDFDAWQ
jgi:ribose 5-phosphate isomerase B